MEGYDFSGWATRNDMLCTDGRIIRRDAFKHCDGLKVPLVWNHDHNDPYRVCGHAILENRAEGVYTYGFFNDTELGKTAREYVEHGDINQLSIYANQLKQQSNNVLHGMIREVSLVLAGANPGAFIENVIKHSDDGGEFDNEAAWIWTGDYISLYHAEEPKMADETKKEETKTEEKSEGGKTIKEIYEDMTDEQKNVVHAMVGMALEDAGAEKNDDDSKGGKDDMKHNVFDNETQITEGGVLSHADQAKIITMAKASNVGSLQTAMSIFAAESGNEALAHGIDDIETLFPEYKDVRPGAPELIKRDQGWVSTVMSKVHKSPISRIRTRQADVRGEDLRAFGYKKGDLKKVPGNIKLLKRTTDPQTVYRKDALHRDDIIDITDFDVVSYQYGIMRENLNEELAMAIMIGDGRDDGDENKIHEEHIRSIWHDDDLYTIHYDVDIDAAKAELQGTNTAANFGENYIYAEAIVTAALYSREKYKGSGNVDFYCTPHLLNVMLLARDLNGRRIYDSKADLAAALNVNAIHTAEQFEGKTRTDSEGNTKKLLGLFVNLSDYQVGSTKGGEITKFQQFDIDFNQEKYLIETRLSGALTRVFSAIALEEPVQNAI